MIWQVLGPAVPIDTQWVLTVPSLLEPVVWGPWFWPEGGRCHASDCDEQCLSSQLSEAALTRPQFRGPFNLTGMLQRDLHICTPFSGLGTAGRPVRPKRGIRGTKLPPGPEGAQQAEAQAQWWASGSEDPAPCSQHSCELILCGFKQQLGSTSPQNAVASLLGQCPSSPGPLRLVPLSLLRKSLMTWLIWF